MDLDQCCIHCHCSYGLSHFHMKRKKSWISHARALLYAAYKISSNYLLIQTMLFKAL